jgi:hypothetical protein
MCCGNAPLPSADGGPQCSTPALRTHGLKFTFNRHGRIYPSNLIVSSAYSKYVYFIYGGVKNMEKFDA